MGRQIDSRVVEMRFDNKAFESGAKKTMDTLDKLKKLLKFEDAGKGLEQLDKSVEGVKLDGISAGIEALTNRFSTMGIVGMRVVQNLTDAMMNQLGKAVSFVTDSIVSGGVKRAMNIENAHFQLQALLKDEAKVQAVMNDAMESVDGTAYAYDEAAKAASQFAASGLQAGEEMQSALKGITGVAAMTNSEYEGISRIFTTVAGQGRLMGDQLLQLSSRGMNAASTIADYFREVQGQANITEAEIRDMVSKGEISFRTFADAMGWAFGDSAKRANETFNGALSNMKSALARIGAGFISPLVEQNGELVQLFNNLRIKINDVKSALVFDESQSVIHGLTKQTKVLNETLTGMTKNGTMSITTFTDSIIGASKSEEELAEINERLVSKFDELSTSGIATKEVFSSFKDEGINAYQYVADYINGVQNGSIEASEEIRKSLKNMYGDVYQNAKSVSDLAEQGTISWDVFTSAVINRAQNVDKELNITEEALKGMFAEVKKEGTVTSKTLREFERNNINANKALLDYINGVKDGSIRASYATKQAIDEMGDSAIQTTHEITRLANDGKISFEIFQSAMEEAYGDSHAASKQFTDSFLGMMTKINKAIQETDLTEPLEIFHYSLESVKNVLKGLWSVSAPFGRAFRRAFLNLDSDSVLNFAKALEELTSRLTLSEENSKELEDAFKGVFDVARLLVDIFFELLGAIIPIEKPVMETSSSFLSLFGAMGRGLSKLTEWARGSVIARKAFVVIQNAVERAYKSIGNFRKESYEFVETIKDWAKTNNIIGEVTTFLDDLANTKDPLARLIDKIRELNPEIGNLDFSNIESAIKSIKTLFENLDLSNEGIEEFIKHAKEYGIELSDAFSWANALDKINWIKEKFNSFIEWYHNTLKPFIGEFTLGDAIASGGGLGIIYALIKMASAFSNIAKIGTSFSDVLTTVNETLTAYQRDLKASALIKIAGAIFILAGALTILSFADTGRLLAATIALSAILGTLAGALIALKKVMDSAKALRPAKKAIDNLALGVKSALKNLSSAVKWKAIGSAIKDMAISLGIIAVTISGLGYLYVKHKDMMVAGMKLAGLIGETLMGFMILMSIVGEFVAGEGMKNFAAAATGVLAISLSLLVIVGALDKLFKMEFPDDWEMRFTVLGGLLLGLAGLTVVAGLAARISGGNKLSVGVFVGIAALLAVTVLALNKLFKMEFPEDYQKRILILGEVFLGIAGLMITMGLAAKLAGGSIKAAGTILAMTSMIAVVIGGLMLLAVIPGERLMNGAKALGVVLLALAASLLATSKIAKGDSAKTVLAMALMVGVITAALSVLGLMSADKLLKGALGLGAVLLAVAAAFAGAGKIKSKNATQNIVAMLAGVIIIAGSLAILAKYPWENLLSAGIAMSAVLYTFGDLLKKISSMKGLKIEKISLFLLATLAVVPIGYAFKELASQPWEGLVASGAAMAVVIYTFGDLLKKISGMSGLNVEKIGLFLLATLAVVPIGYELSKLANYSWDSLLSAGISMAAVLLSLGTTLKMLSSIKGLNPLVIAEFVGAAVSTLIIGEALQGLAVYDWKSLLAAGTALSEVLLVMAGTLTICTMIGGAAPAAAAGIVAFDLFVADLAIMLAALGALWKNESVQELLNGGLEMMSKLGQGLGNFIGGIVEGAAVGVGKGLEAIGLSLSQFIINAMPFITLAKTVDQDTLDGTARLAGAIILLTGAEIIAAIGSVLSGNLSLASLGTELSAFGVAVMPFVMAIKNVKPEDAEGAKAIAEMIVVLTAANLLNGITKLLTFGESSLENLGKELVPFGEQMKKFSDEVKGIDVSAVEGAATAAKMMSEVARNLPAQNGLASLIFGEHSLEAFGRELVAFGVQMKLFSFEVKNLDVDAVTGASTAAKMMSEVANNLPAQGGLTSVIFGEHSLESFGMELVAFGVQMKLFSWEVRNLDPSVLNGTVLMTETMSELAKNLPDQETLLNKIFGGGQMTFSDFGKELSKFASEMVDFSTNASEVNFTAITSLVGAVSDLTGLGEAIKAFDGNGFELFIQAFENLNLSSVENFCETFRNSAEQVGPAIEQFSISIETAIEILLPLSWFYQAGYERATQFSTGMVNALPKVNQDITYVDNAIQSRFKMGLPAAFFIGIGGIVSTSVGTGITSKIGIAISASTRTTSEVSSTFRNGLKPSEFDTIGKGVGDGLRSGIESKIREIADSVISACRKVIDSAKNALGVHSPSTEFFSIGKFLMIGLANGISKTTGVVEDETTEAANQSINVISKMMQSVAETMQDNSFEMELKVVPILDMDNLNADMISAEKQMDYRLDIRGLYEDVAEISALSAQNNKTKVEKETKEKPQIVNNNYAFNQTNNSPKALSPIEIYRNTNNQFSAFKKAVKT